MKKLLAVVISSLVIVGCKTKIETTINTDSLQLTEHALVVGNIEVEVPS